MSLVKQNEEIESELKQVLVSIQNELNRNIEILKLDAQKKVTEARKLAEGKFKKLLEDADRKIKQAALPVEKCAEDSNFQLHEGAALAGLAGV